MKRRTVFIACVLVAAMLTACNAKAGSSVSGETTEEETTETETAEEEEETMEEETTEEETTEEETDASSQGSTEARKEDSAESYDIPKGATNQEDAAELLLEKDGYGTIESKDNLWYQFTTSVKGTYTFIMLNKTSSEDWIAFELYDDLGREVGDRFRVQGTGRVATYEQELEANTAYYINVWTQSGGNDIYTANTSQQELRLTIKGPEEPVASSESGGEGTAEAEKPVNEATIIMEDTAGVMVSDVGNIRGGTNQDDAILLPMNTKLYGTTGEGGWYAFTTGSNSNAVYYIRTINKTLGSNLVGLNLYDAKGSNLGYSQASDYGLATVLTTDQLSPNTVYYLYIRGGEMGSVWHDSDEKINYRLDITEKDAQTTGYSTSDRINEARGAAAALEGTVNPGSNQDDAAFVPVNAKLGGTTTGTGLWFAFMTGKATGTYEIVTVNKTPGSNLLGLNLYDELGNNLGYSRADDGGKATTVSFDDLSPDTVYYIRICGGTMGSSWHDSDDKIDYTLQINAPEEPEAATATVETADDLVFEQPLSLNETQIMFKPESADFIDSAAAEAALKPVADIILAHPDHPILLAGTTATDGDQENRRELSERRAEAVKKMLVNKFGVPEGQLQTIGLGYADDPFERGADRVPEGDPSGKWVASEAPRNRRTIVLDAESEIAKQILGQ